MHFLAEFSTNSSDRIKDYGKAAAMGAVGTTAIAGTIGYAASKAGGSRPTRKAWGKLLGRAALSGATGGIAARFAKNQIDKRTNWEPDSIRRGVITGAVGGGSGIIPMLKLKKAYGKGNIKVIAGTALTGGIYKGIGSGYAKLSNAIGRKVKGLFNRKSK
jgi:hypothetical protein